MAAMGFWATIRLVRFQTDPLPAVAVAGVGLCRSCGLGRGLVVPDAGVSNSRKGDRFAAGEHARLSRHRLLCFASGFVISRTYSRVTALLGQHVASLFINYPSASELIAAGNLRVLATASLKRNELLANVPTVAELGYPDFEEDAWFGVVVPAKTPGQVVAQLANWFGGAVVSGELKPRLRAQGFSVAGECGRDFASFLRTQQAIIKEAKLK